MIVHIELETSRDIQQATGIINKLPEDVLVKVACAIHSDFLLVADNVKHDRRVVWIPQEPTYPPPPARRR